MKAIRKILITGASGFVGGRAAEALQKAYELLTPSRSELDVTSEEEIERYIQGTQPDAILHLAAISNTGYCEEHPEESYLVNVVSVENLAKAAAKHDIKLVWFSSDQIYNGNTGLGPLTEDIAAAPENHYGRHKLLAERLVIADTERFPQHIRNISISMKKAHDASGGKIRFMSTLEGLEDYLKNQGS